MEYHPLVNVLAKFAFDPEARTHVPRLRWQLALNRLRDRKHGDSHKEDTHHARTRMARGSVVYE